METCCFNMYRNGRVALSKMSTCCGQVRIADFVPLSEPIVAANLWVFCEINVGIHKVQAGKFVKFFLLPREDAGRGFCYF